MQQPCTYFTKAQNSTDLAICVCPDTYSPENNIICIKNEEKIVLLENYGFTIVVTAMLIIVFMKMMSSMDPKSKKKIDVNFIMYVH